MELINSYNPSEPNFRPTEIYNESWLIKLILHHASSIKGDGFPIGFEDSSTWFSEALLPTVFKARYWGDKLSETRTNADGIIGQIKIGEQAKTDLELSSNATQFTVIEAKINAPLSSGVSHAKYFDQAARSVACMAQVMAKAVLDPASLECLCFIVLAPQDSIDRGTFIKELNPESIQSKVKKRVDSYDGQLDDWYKKVFRPTLDHITIKS
jgi:hypothetical protein